jgi:hypothetical protein
MYNCTLGCSRLNGCPRVCCPGKQNVQWKIRRNTILSAQKAYNLHHVVNVDHPTTRCLRGPAAPLPNKRPIFFSKVFPFQIPFFWGGREHRRAFLSTCLRFAKYGPVNVCCMTYLCLFGCLHIVRSRTGADLDIWAPIGLAICAQNCNFFWGYHRLTVSS